MESEKENQPQKCSVVCCANQIYVKNIETRLHKRGERSPVGSCVKLLPLTGSGIGAFVSHVGAVEGDPGLPTSMCTAHVRHRWLKKYLHCEIG